MANNQERWENYVNNYIFANFENLEYWVAKRQAADNNGAIYNYILFPKDENGRILTRTLLEYMIQSIEADKNVCENFFGPEYSVGSAEIVDNGQNLSIIWNKHLYVDLIEETDSEDDVGFRFYIEKLYNWPIFEGPSKNLPVEEIERRKKIDDKLRNLAKILNDPRLSPDGRSPKEMEYIYTHYDFDNI